MKHIQILGFDCATCRKTYRRIEETALKLGVSIQLEKIDDPVLMMAHRVMVPPGVVVDGRLVHSGGLPDRKHIEAWLA